MSSPKLPLIALVGPTAVGKTGLSLKIAKKFQAEIISADSRLFYRGMTIGTAKPNPAEMARVPHHLIDIANPDETWSLAMFQQAAQHAVEEIHSRKKIPMLVGGTGQYIRAVTAGWSPPEVAPDPKLRAAIEHLAASLGSQWLHEKLALLDPIAAQKIDHRNLRRTVRALEVIFSTGKKFSAQTRLVGSPFSVLTIGLMRPREELYARVDARIEAMFEQGLLEEVEALLKAGYTTDLPSMSSIGYRECVAVLRGEMSLDEAKTQMRRLTRIFVRRQSNWFKSDAPDIHWFSANDRDLAEKTLQLIEQWLTSLKNQPQQPEQR